MSKKGSRMFKIGVFVAAGLLLLMLFNLFAPASPRAGRAPHDPTLIPQLATHAVRIVARPDEEEGNILLRYLLSWSPLLLILGLWLYTTRRVLAVLTRILERMDTIRACNSP